MILDQLPTVSGASFDSHDKEYNTTCLADTRTKLLADIAERADNSQSKPVFWLNGMTGTGKSTISRTVAQTFASPNRLRASFFFKRGEFDRANLAKSSRQ